MLYNLPKDRWVLAVKRWHPDNPLLGVNPFCTYCDNPGSCPDCAMQFYKVCGAMLRGTGYYHKWQAYVESQPANDLMSPPTKKEKKLAAPILRAIMKDGVRLGYVKSVKDVPNWEELNKVKE